MTLFEEGQGVAQHHDSVSGTEKQHVAYDYAKRIATGMAVAEAQNNNFLANAVTIGTTSTPPKFQQCQLLNVSSCDVTSGLSSFAALLYNPLPRSRSYHVRLPVSGNVVVLDGAGNMVASEMTANTLPGSVVANSIAFQAQLPAMGYATYFVTNSSEARAAPPAKKRPSALTHTVNDTNITVSNGIVTLVFDTKTGRLQSFANYKTGVSMTATQEWMYYRGSPSDDQASGAYIFRPNTSNAMPVNTAAVNITVQQNTTVAVVTQVWADWLVQVCGTCERCACVHRVVVVVVQEIRLWEDDDFVVPLGPFQLTMSGVKK